MVWTHTYTPLGTSPVRSIPSHRQHASDAHQQTTSSMEASVGYGLVPGCSTSNSRTTTSTTRLRAITAKNTHIDSGSSKVLRVQKHVYPQDCLFMHGARARARAAGEGRASCSIVMKASHEHTYSPSELTPRMSSSKSSCSMQQKSTHTYTFLGEPCKLRCFSLAEILVMAATASAGRNGKIYQY